MTMMSRILPKSVTVTNVDFMDQIWVSSSETFIKKYFNSPIDFADELGIEDDIIFFGGMDF